MAEVRHWLSLKHRSLTVISLDGEQIILIHVRDARREGRLPVDADTTPEAGL